MPIAPLGVPSQVTSGQQLLVRNDGYVPGTTVEVYIASDPTFLGSGVADSFGGVAITVTIPTGLTGQHSIVLYVPDLGLGTRQIIQIASGAATGGTLPATGGALGWTPPAIGLLLGGAAIVLIARRPRVR
jgi:LPXTG-motif cell wall-anchored protein